MQVAKDRILSEENPFILRETNLGILNGRPFRLSGGAIFFCKKGTAEVSIDTKTYTISPRMQAIILPDSVIMTIKSTSDFKVVFFYFTRQLFEDAHRQLDPSFFHHIKGNPVYRHSPVSARLARQVFSLIGSIYSDMANRYRTAIATNYLRNILLNASDKIQRNSAEPHTGVTRKEEIYHRFINLILEYCTCHRDVEFYADKLCISKRYLAVITHQILGETPKQTIDKHVVQEIKTLLVFTDMTMQQLAESMNFTDQSYLGRFFKHHVGESLSSYRPGVPVR